MIRRGGGHRWVMADTRASAVAEALQQFEQDRDLDTFACVFTDDVELLRPERCTGETGRDGVAAFWQSYLDQFGVIRSTSSRVVEGGDLGELEWSSRGTLGSGRPVEYEGVSLLVFADGGKVARFATYYDPAALAARLG